MSEQVDVEQQKRELVLLDLFVEMEGNTKKMLKLSVAVAEKAGKAGEVAKKMCGAKLCYHFFNSTK